MKHLPIPIWLLAPCFLAAQPAPKIDTTTFVVMGEGLAAGMADFALRDVYQKSSFPALIAKQIGTAFPQPLIQPPGIGSVPGFAELPVAVPGPWQTTVRKPFPPPLFVFNLAVPRHTLVDAINLRPVAPLVQPNNPKQTVTNLLLGYPALILDTDKPLWSQLEYAVAMNPSLVLIELGYTEALEAAVAGDASRMPDTGAFRTNYAKVLSTLKQSTTSQAITTTIPDPLDTAYFSSLASAAQMTGADTGKLSARYGLKDGDLLSPHAIFAIANGEDLPANSVIGAARVTDLRARVRALNSEITGASKDAGALLYDLNGLFARVRSSGVSVGKYRLTADYLGGFYSLSGSYPGCTAQALIANEILGLLNQTFGTAYKALDLAQVAPVDPAVRMRLFRLP